MSSQRRDVLRVAKTQSDAAHTTPDKTFELYRLKIRLKLFLSSRSKYAPVEGLLCPLVLIVRRHNQKQMNLEMKGAMELKIRNSTDDSVRQITDYQKFRDSDMNGFQLAERPTLSGVRPTTLSSKWLSWGEKFQSTTATSVAKDKNKQTHTLPTHIRTHTHTQTKQSWEKPTLLSYYCHQFLPTQSSTPEYDFLME